MSGGAPGIAAALPRAVPGGAAPATAAIAAGGGAEIGAVIADDTLNLSETLCSALRNASAVWKRFAGSLARAITMMSLSALRQIRPQLDGAAWNLIQMRGEKRDVASVLNGGCPVANSYSVTPRE